MRIFFLWGCLISLFLTGFGAFAQKSIRSARQLTLPDSLGAGAREFSSLATYGDRLYLLAENRDDHLKEPTRGVYSIALDELGDHLAGALPQISTYRYHPLSGVGKVMQTVEGYQGLEALVLLDDRFFITIETEQFADSCYLITGKWGEDEFLVDTTRVLALKKPVLPDGEKVFNAGFEALTVVKGELYAFFEYNGLPENFAYRITIGEEYAAEQVPLAKRIPFRLTDAAGWRKNVIVGVNYFFPLKAEAIYQQDLNRREEASIRKGGALHPFARLAVMKVGRKKIKLKRFIAVPEVWWTSNWEGIARYKGGVLMVNDKFTRNGGRESQLLFLDFKGKARD